MLEIQCMQHETYKHSKRTRFITFPKHGGNGKNSICRWRQSQAVRRRILPWHRHCRTLCSSSAQRKRLPIVDRRRIRSHPFKHQIVQPKSEQEFGHKRYNAIIFFWIIQYPKNLHVILLNDIYAAHSRSFPYN